MQLDLEWGSSLALKTFWWFDRVPHRCRAINHLLSVFILLMILHSILYISLNYLKLLAFLLHFWLFLSQSQIILMLHTFILLQWYRIISRCRFVTLNCCLRISMWKIGCWRKIIHRAFMNHSSMCLWCKRLKIVVLDWIPIDRVSI